MSETAQQYTQRLLNNLGEANPVEVIEATTARLETLSRRLREKGWHQAPANKWSGAQILAHLAEAEIVVAYRIRRALNDPGKPIEAYDQNEWVRNAGYLESDPELAFSLFQTVRKVNIARLKSLTPEQWERFGMHSERGKESILHMTRLLAGHDINHLQQMEILVS
jgi:DinB family protein